MGALLITISGMILAGGMVAKHYDPGFDKGDWCTVAMLVTGATGLALL